jgi:hypothetical protein
MKGGSAMVAGKTSLARALVLAALGLAEPRAAIAQAWLPPRGNASLTVGYQFYRSTDRYTTSTGERYYDGHTRQHGLVGYFNYSITDRLAVSVGLPPYFLSSYNGPDPHRWPVFDDGSIATDSSGTALFLPPTIDDGSSHGSFQDLRGELSFLALEGSWVVTPFVGFQLPSHDYEYHAQTAVGRGLWDLRIGANVGRRLDPLLPEAYFHGRYAFAYRQATQDLRFNYSYVDLELGYFVTPSLSLRILGSSQIAHDGLKDEEYHFDGPKPDAYSLSQWLYVSSEDEQMRGQPALPVALRHDQLDYATSYNLGVGASFAVTPRVDVSAQVFKTFWGRGGRPTDLAVSVWSTFSLSRRRSSAKEPPGGAGTPGPSYP